MLRTPKTIRFYEYTVGGLVEWLIQEEITEPNQIKSIHIRAFLAQTAKRGVRDITVHAFARGSKAFLRFLHDEDYIQKPIRVNMPKVGKKQLPILNPQQLKQILEACKTQRDKALILVLIDTGVRSSELCKLTWGDVNLKTGIIRVRAGKGRKDRTVIIGLKTRRVILKYRRSVAHQITDSLFYLKPAGVCSALNRLGSRIGIHLNPHLFRRTFATLSLKAGINPIHLQSLMGHSTLEQTRKYIKLVDDDLKDAHKRHGPVDSFLK
jgi:integrase/recombinase XerD